VEKESRLLGVLLATDFYLFRSQIVISVFMLFQNMTNTFARTPHGVVGVRTKFHDSGNRNFGTGLRNVIYVHCFI
jgi:hypothetical protein